jgi:hypothetical protein
MHVPRPGPAAALEQLVERVPELRPEWETHLDDYGEALPHVFMADVARFTKGHVFTASNDLLDRLAAAVEEMAASDDPDVENVVAVSYFEWFVLGDPDELEALAELRPRLGPKSLGLVELWERHRDA